MKPEERYERNLDGAYNAVLEEREAELLRREMLEDMILKDEETFHSLAMAYCYASMNAPLFYGFMDWAVDQLLREEEPQYDHAWMTDKELSDLQAGERDCRERPSNKEYWNFNDDRV